MLWVLKRTISMRRFFLSTQNICLKLKVRKYLQFYAENFCLSEPLNFILHFQVKVVATLEHPFFVFGKGWSSCEPSRTLQRFGLSSQRLNVNDVCVSLTHKDVTKHAAEISKHQQQSGMVSGSDFQPVKSEPCSDVTDSKLHRSPGQGQGSHVQGQGQDQRSGVNPPQCVGQNEEQSAQSSRNLHTPTQEHMPQDS